MWQFSLVYRRLTLTSLMTSFVWRMIILKALDSCLSFRVNEHILKVQQECSAQMWETGSNRLDSENTHRKVTKQSFLELAVFQREENKMPLRL